MTLIVYFLRRIARDYILNLKDYAYHTLCSHSLSPEVLHTANYVTERLPFFIEVDIVVEIIELFEQVGHLRRLRRHLLEFYLRLEIHTPATPSQWEPASR